MNFIEFIKTKVFVRHFIISIVISAVLIIVILTMLKGYTHHGDSYKIPSLLGLTPSADTETYNHR